MYMYAIYNNYPHDINVTFIKVVVFTLLVMIQWLLQLKCADVEQGQEQLRCLCLNMVDCPPAGSLWLWLEHVWYK